MGAEQQIAGLEGQLKITIRRKDYAKGDLVKLERRICALRNDPNQLHHPSRGKSWVIMSR